jgi:hypothetical protein
MVLPDEVLTLLEEMYEPEKCRREKRDNPRAHMHSKWAEQRNI